MNRVFYYAICGIYTGADDPAAWSNQAQAWFVDQEYCQPGESGGYTYFADVFGGPLSDDQHADKIAGDFDAAASINLDIDVVAHSNGCKIILDVLARHTHARIRNLTLLAAAAIADCEANGLNLAISRAQVGHVVFCCSTMDEWLGVGKMLGYGDLGKVGPQKASALLSEKSEVAWKNYLHNDWTGPAFDESMTRVATLLVPDGWGE